MSGPIGDAAPDFAQMGASTQATLAVVVAAAGGHHLWLCGSPGTGRVMLAAAVHALLPDLSMKEVWQSARLASLRPNVQTRSRRPPWQAPHHSASLASIIGGGTGGRLMPGAVSLAHHGVLFLEQAGELPSGHVHAVAAALHHRQVVLARAGASVTFPARFQLVMATEPCPTMLHRPDAVCICGPLVRQRYRQRVAALAARCDLRIDLDGPTGDGDPYQVVGRTTVELAARVMAVRKIARRRWRGKGLWTNADATAGVLSAEPAELPPAAAAELNRHYEAGTLSTRGRAAVLRVAWTLADLAGRGRPDPVDLHEALLLHGHG